MLYALVPAAAGLLSSPLTPFARATAPVTAPATMVIGGIDPTDVKTALEIGSAAFASGAVTNAGIRGVVTKTGNKGSGSVVSWYDSGLRLDGSTVAVEAPEAPAPTEDAPAPAPATTPFEAPPPDGFEWGGLFVFDESSAATTPVAAAAPVAAPVAAPEPVVEEVVEVPEPVSTGSTWGIVPLGNPTAGAHRMQGTFPIAKREIWTPPAGWTKPTKPVQSWYDKGERLTKPVSSWYDKGLRLVTKMAPFYDPAAAEPKPVAAPVDPAVTAWAVTSVASALALMTPAEGLMMLSGAATREKLLAAGVPRDEISASLAMIAASFTAAAPKSTWGIVPLGNPTAGAHRMQGTFPIAKREIWTPPAGWTKPTKPVQSWYDKGERLIKPVSSWYDKGLRLVTKMAPFYEA